MMKRHCGPFYRFVLDRLAPLDLRREFHTIVIDEAQDVNPPHGYLFLQVVPASVNQVRFAFFRAVFSFLRYHRF